MQWNLGQSQSCWRVNLGSHWCLSILEDYIKAKIDPKVSADKCGHDIGVCVRRYTKSSMKDRLEDSQSSQEDEAILTRDYWGVICCAR